MDKNNIHVLSRAVIVDQGHILLCKTALDFPTLFYALPGGHVEYGESAESSLIRELLEETRAACRIIRFLGCLEYQFDPGQGNICHNHEYNLIFEVESESLKMNQSTPQLEDHLELVWMPLSDLSSIDFRAEPLKELAPQWLKLSFNEAFKSVMK